MALHRVFVASTSNDLVEYRKAALEAIRAANLRSDGMEDWPADTRDGATYSTDRVGQCDAVVLIVAHRYGSTVADTGLSVTELEYDAARTAGIPVLAFVVDDSVPWPPALVDVEERARERLRAFKEKIHAELTVRSFENADRLRAFVGEALGSLRANDLNDPKKSGTQRDSTRIACLPSRLKDEPDGLIRIGHGPDGLPLLLDVQRSQDVDSPVAQIARILQVDDEADSDSRRLIDQLRTDVERHARMVWQRQGIHQVAMRDGSVRELFVHDVPLVELFTTLLHQILEGGHNPTFTRVDVLRSQYRAQGEDGHGAGDPLLGISLDSGALYAIGSTPGGGFTERRPFTRESLRGLGSGGTYLEMMGHELDLSEEPRSIRDRVDRLLVDSDSDRCETTLRVSRSAALRTIADVADRLTRLHDAGVLHGDLKPLNILIGEDGPELIDSLSVDIGDTAPAFSSLWAPPEVLTKSASVAVSDLYALGLMLSAVLPGRLVGEWRQIDAGTSAGVFPVSRYFDPKFVHSGGPCSREWSGLVERTLRWNPGERIGSAALLAAEIRDLVDRDAALGDLDRCSWGEIQRVYEPDRVSMFAARSINSRNFFAPPVAYFPPPAPPMYDSDEVW